MNKAKIQFGANCTAANRYAVYQQIAGDMYDVSQNPYDGKVGDQK